nr:uncharacterized protein LOC109192135 [Ipomoea trifida]
MTLLLLGLFVRDLPSAPVTMVAHRGEHSSDFQRGGRGRWRGSCGCGAAGHGRGAPLRCQICSNVVHLAVSCFRCYSDMPAPQSQAHIAVVQFRPLPAMFNFS